MMEEEKQGRWVEKQWKKRGKMLKKHSHTKDTLDKRRKRQQKEEKEKRGKERRRAEVGHSGGIRKWNNGKEKHCGNYEEVRLTMILVLFTYCVMFIEQV